MIVAKCIQNSCKAQKTKCNVDEMIADACRDKPNALNIEECIRDVRAEINRLDTMDSSDQKVEGETVNSRKFENELHGRFLWVISKFKH